MVRFDPNKMLSRRPSENKIATDRRFCCYKGCSSDQIKTRDGAISFFGFPIKDTERCSIWISHCGREEFRFLTPRELQYKRMCELHFPPNMFSNEFRTKLKKNAVPVDFRVFSQEPIQIDDDDEDNDDVSDEGESGIVSETSSNNNITCENDQDNQAMCVVEPVSDVANNESNIFSQSTEDESEIQTRSNVVSAVLLNNFGPSSEKSNEENSLQIEKRTPETQQLHRLTVEKQSISAKSVSEEKNTSSPVLSKSVKNLIRRKRYNTKFHNLPPQTTQSDFYFQQCPTAEETNSFSEPPDGELPLFVQQDSLASLADERANSGISEPPSKKRKKDKDNDDLADQMRDTMKQLMNISALLNTSDDEFELFGKSVALQLKKMSLCTALTVQAKIQHLLSQSRINDIQKNTKEKSTENCEMEETKAELKVSSEEDKLESPQLSLNCVSDCSENQETEIG